MTDSNKNDSGKSFARGATSFISRVFILVLGAVMADLGGYLLNEYIKPKPICVNIQVFDDSTPANSLNNTAVWLGLNDAEPKQTVDFGVVRFADLSLEGPQRMWKPDLGFLFGPESKRRRIL
jgi:hypothetical protein